MNSDSMKNLLPALAAAITDMPDPKKNLKNTHFGNKYADLGAVLECIATPLSAHGLVLTQTMREGNVLVTRCWHAASGEWIESCATLKPEKDTPQGMASAMTYARRYAIKALFGLSDVDDDGNAASKSAPAKPAAPAVKVEPFEQVADAVAALLKAPDEAALRAVGNRIAESKFGAEDAKTVRETWVKRRNELAPNIPNKKES